MPSANVAGDPVAIIRRSWRSWQLLRTTDCGIGRTFLTKRGIPPVTAAADPAITNRGILRLHGRQASQFVIRRTMSQLGMPPQTRGGGGNANGPSRGIAQGANALGFDCCGLMQYAFAGVGINATISPDRNTARAARILHHRCAAVPSSSTARTRQHELCISAAAC